MKGPAPALDEIQDSLHLQEVHLPVQVGSPGELPLLRPPGPGAETASRIRAGDSHPPWLEISAMSSPGIAVGPGKEGHQHLVQTLPGFRILSPGQDGPSWVLGRSASPGQTRPTMEKASGPDRRTTARALGPGGVPMATMVSGWPSPLHESPPSRALHEGPRIPGARESPLATQG